MRNKELVFRKMLMLSAIQGIGNRLRNAMHSNQPMRSLALTSIALEPLLPTEPSMGTSIKVLPGVKTGIRTF